MTLWLSNNLLHKNTKKMLSFLFGKLYLKNAKIHWQTLSLSLDEVLKLRIIGINYDKINVIIITIEKYRTNSEKRSKRILL